MRNIVYIDSGIGGIPYMLSLDAATNRSRDNHLIYVADQRYFPYGEQSSSLLNARLRVLTASCVQSFRPVVVVVACNTGTVTALSEMRRQHPDIEFIGIVPAVKVATKMRKSATICILVTEQTARGEYLHDLINTYAPDHETAVIAVGDLVRLIERSADTLHYRPTDSGRELMKSVVAEIRSARAGAVVLGCSHFLYIKHALQEELGSECAIIDSLDGVTQRTADVLSAIPLSSGTIAGDDAVHHHAHLNFFTTATGCSDAVQQLLDAHNISFGGTLTV